MLETRNHEGKNSLFLSIEHEKYEIAHYLLDNYPQLNLLKKDSFNGNNVLHWACYKDNMQITKRIFEKDPDLCLVKNFEGHIPIYNIIDRGNF